MTTLYCVAAVGFVILFPSILIALGLLAKTIEGGGGE
jgi:hypothetical protein